MNTIDRKVLNSPSFLKQKYNKTPLYKLKL
jgi:hypothetical protein